MTERRAPLGGVDKETFVHSAKDPDYHAELAFNLLSGLKSDLCHEIKLIGSDVAAIKKQCSCRVAECKADFDKRYVKRFSEKIPFSKGEVVVYAIIFGALIGLGYIAVDKIFKIPI